MTVLARQEVTPWYVVGGSAVVGAAADKTRYFRMIA